MIGWQASNMKIFYNCTSLEFWDNKKSHDTGIQRVVREMGGALCRESDAVVPVVFDSDGKCFRVGLSRRSPRGEEVCVEKGDLIFSAGHDWDCPAQYEAVCRLSSSGVHLGTLFYDAMPVNLPFTYRDEFVERFKSWLSLSLRHSQVLLAISSFTRDNIASHNYGPGVGDFGVVRLGDLVPSRGGEVSPDIKKRMCIPYILSVGTVEYRKNHAVLLNAYRMMLHEMCFEPPMLYIVGGQGLMDGGVVEQAERDPRLRGRVKVLRGVDDASLNALYENSMFTVYPSFFEGWGLPVAESLRYGKPCITSSASSMLEIAPELTRFCHPHRPDQWASQIMELCSNQNLLEEETKKVKESYVPSTWQDAARSVLNEIYMKVPVADGFQG